VEQGRDLSTALAGLGSALALYALFVLALVLAGRRSDARALAGFIPVAGQLDDAFVLALVLRSVLRGSGPELVREHWRGPGRSLAVVLRLAGAS